VKKPSIGRGRRTRDTIKGLSYVFSFKHKELFCNLPSATNGVISDAIQSFGTNLGFYADISHVGLFLTDYSAKWHVCASWRARPLEKVVTLYDLYRPVRGTLIKAGPSWHDSRMTLWLCVTLRRLLKLPTSRTQPPHNS
jgi:hypothetical protein